MPPDAPDPLATTTDHALIRRWAEARGAQPSRVREGGVRLYLPGAPGGDEVEPVTWAAWFRSFEADGLAFEYARAGNANRLVPRGATQRTKVSGAGAATAEEPTTRSRRP